MVHSQEMRWVAALLCIVLACQLAGAVPSPRQIARYRQYQRNAKARGKKFTLKLNDIVRHWRKPCTYCNAPLHEIGLDRVDSSRGYEPDNIVPCCFTCNQMKGSMSLDDFLLRIAAVDLFRRTRK